MDYQEALTYMETAARAATPKASAPERFGIVMGLDSIRELMARLGNPQDGLRIVHVAGTNGKGSICAFTANILAQAGFLVGRYVSPVLKEYEEKVQRTDRAKTAYISQNEVAAFVTKISKVVEGMLREGFAHPTPFELETAMAFLAFCQWRCDFVVLEVGMGGRLDATNVIKRPLCSVLAPIGIDHARFLGDDVARIAFEKAGIIKAAPVISAPQGREALAVIREACKEAHATLSVVGKDDLSIIRTNLQETTFSYRGQEYLIRLLGKHQAANAAVALETALTLRRLGHPVSDDSLRTGLRLTRLDGRMEVLNLDPFVLFDVAHNPDAARALADNLAHYFPESYKIAVLGFMADKDYPGVIRELNGLFCRAHAVSPRSHRALSAKALAAALGKGPRPIPASPHPSMEGALRACFQEAKSHDGNAIIVIFGSFSLGAEAYAAFSRKTPKHTID